jgi:hypothetical protein
MSRNCFQNNAAGATLNTDGQNDLCRWVRFIARRRGNRARVSARPFGGALRRRNTPGVTRRARRGRGQPSRPSSRL